MSQLAIPTQNTSTEIASTQNDVSTRDELIERYQGLALSIARRRCHRLNDREDVEQVAMMALIKAADRFDPDRGVTFSTFAWSTIEGEVKRYFRDHSSAIHVNRALRERSLRVATAVDELTNTLGRSPTMVEVAESEGMSVESVIEAHEVLRTYQPMSIDGTRFEDDEPFEIAVDDDQLISADDRGLLMSLTKHLTKRERVILSLRFYEQRSQAEIGAMLGLSQMHVSRLLDKSLATLRKLAEPV